MTDTLDPEGVYLELDGRRRASLGKIGRPEHRRYLAATDPDGTITLRPIVFAYASSSSSENKPEIR